MLLNNQKLAWIRVSCNLHMDCPMRNLHDLCGMVGLFKTFGVSLHENASTTFYLVTVTLVSWFLLWCWFRMNQRQRSHQWRKKKTHTRKSQILTGSIAWCSEKDTGFEIRSVPTLCLLVLWSWASHISLLRSHFLTCKIMTLMRLFLRSN